VAVVTGANRGIGRDVVRQLAERGATVYLGARRPDAARRAAGTMDASLDVRALDLDVTDPASVAAAARTVADAHGRLDVLVNNAAVHYDTGERATDPDFTVVAEALATNVVGAWRCAAAFTPLLVAGRHGRIVNVSSGAGSLAGIDGSTPAYSLSKAALNALTLLLAGELRPHGVLVNSVCPGWVATDMGGPGGRPVADGAAGVVWAATLDDDGPTGGFFRDGQAIDL
jgi:NAD(P)-dependent dehydrogenase (short-subunit alcohol dehydrogenase family)